MYIYSFWSRISKDGRAWVDTMRNYATSRKVEGSFPVEVVGLLSLPNPSSRTMALGSTQSVTEMSTRNLPGVKGRKASE
jgi:hypothetical protein